MAAPNDRDQVPPGHDQVPRKLAYEQAHPDARFSPPCEHDSTWRVKLGETGEDAVEVKAPDLRQLLDRLDKLG